MLKNGKLQLALFCFAHAAILLPLFNTVYRMLHASTPLYLDYASRIFQGSLPYRDFSLEYPPMALAFFILPRLFSANLSVFAGAFEIEVLIFDLLGLYLFYRIARNNGDTPWKMMAMYSAAILAIGPIIIESYDIFPAILTLLSLYLFSTGKHKTAWLILALGFMTKLYPAVIAPVYIFYYLRDRQYKRIWSGIGVFAAACLIILLPFLVMAPDSLLQFINFHSSRPIQLETTYSSVLLFISQFSTIDFQIQFSSGAQNIVGPVSDILATISLFLLVFFLLAAYWLIFRRIKKEKNGFTEMGVYALLVILILLAAGKILSPQYLIWLCTLIPLITGKKGLAVTAVFILIGVLTYYIYPLHYEELAAVKSPVAAVLLVRNILLILLAVMTAVFLTRKKTALTGMIPGGAA
jgi:uncharacterized membrane protein